MITGHTTFRDLSGFDPCLAAVAGLLKTRVMWFDDSILAEREDFEGDRWMLAIEHGAPDPTHRTLVTSGTYYNFTDPNGMTWNITESWFEKGAAAYQYDLDGDGQVDIDPSQGANNAANASGETIRYYVWEVELQEATYDVDADVLYNFVNMVDTCKFNDAFNGTAQHDGSEPGHLASDGNHSHEKYLIDLYDRSEEPNYLRLDVDPPHRAATNETAP